MNSETVLSVLKDKALKSLERFRGFREPRVEDIFQRIAYIFPSDVTVINYARKPVALFNPGAVLVNNELWIFPRLIFDYYTYVSSIGLFKLRVEDLLSKGVEKLVEIRIVGGLLGHWAFWTKRSMEMFEYIKSIRNSKEVPRELITLAHQVTDVNGAVFDAFNDFRGCIPGVQEMLRRVGLLETNLTLDPEETLSPGQLEEIDRIWNSYPHLRDEAFVARYRDEWIEGKCIGFEYRVPSLEELFKPIYAVR